MADACIWHKGLLFRSSQNKRSCLLPSGWKVWVLWLRELFISLFRVTPSCTKLRIWKVTKLWASPDCVLGYFASAERRRVRVKEGRSDIAAHKCYQSYSMLSCSVTLPIRFLSRNTPVPPSTSPIAPRDWRKSQLNHWHFYVGEGKIRIRKATYLKSYIDSVLWSRWYSGVPKRWPRGHIQPTEAFKQPAVSTLYLTYEQAL